MKKIGLILLFVNYSAFSFDAESLKEISEQFSNRNWNYHAAEYARKSKLTNYSDLDYIKLTKDKYRTTTQDFETHSVEDLQSFYPELDILTAEDVAELSVEFERKSEAAEMLSQWSDLLSTLSTESWTDPDVELCADSDDPINDDQCGRNSKAQYALMHMNQNQKDKLDSLKDIVHEDIMSLFRENFEIPMGPELARFYQVVMDKRAVFSLINKRYLEIGADYESEAFKLKFIAIAQAIIIQSFLDVNGELLTSDLFTIDLEKESCNALSTKLERTECLYTYLKYLLIDYEFTATEEPINQSMTNLVLDPKVVAPYLESILTNFEFENTELSEAQGALPHSNMYFAVSYAWGVDITEEFASAHPQATAAVNSQIKQGIQYFYSKRDLLGLKFNLYFGYLYKYLKGLTDA